jgi:hypothetical protein
LLEYYGQTNEYRKGLSTKVPVKPEALIRYEQIKSFGIPYVDGGYLDQPYLWTLEHGVVENFIQMTKSLQAQEHRMTQELKRSQRGGINHGASPQAYE